MVCIQLVEINKYKYMNSCEIFRCWYVFVQIEIFMFLLKQQQKKRSYSILYFSLVASKFAFEDKNTFKYSLSPKVSISRFFISWDKASTEYAL